MIKRNLIKTLLFFTVIFGFSLPSLADGNLLVGLWSNHQGPCDRSSCPYENKYNETHNLIGYIDDSISYGYMKNSWNNDSVFVAKVWDKDINTYIRSHLVVGVATGYKDYIPLSLGPLAFVGYMGIDIHPKHDKFGIMLSVIPGEVLAIGFRIKI